MGIAGECGEQLEEDEELDVGEDDTEEQEELELGRSGVTVVLP